MLITKAQMMPEIETARRDMNETLRMRSKTEETRTENLILAVYTAGGLLVGSGVIASVIYLFLTLSSQVVVNPAFGQSATAPAWAGVPLEARIETEDVDGGMNSTRHIDIHQPKFAFRAQDLARLHRTVPLGPGVCEILHAERIRESTVDRS